MFEDLHILDLKKMKWIKNIEMGSENQPGIFTFFFVFLFFKQKKKKGKCAGHTANLIFGKYMVNSFTFFLKFFFSKK